MKVVKCTYRETPFSYRIGCEEDEPLLQPPPDTVLKVVYELLLDPVDKSILHANISIIVPEERLEQAKELARKLVEEVDTKPYAKFTQYLYLRDNELLSILRSYLKAIYSNVDFEKIIEELEYRNLQNEVEIRYVVRRLKS